MASSAADAASTAPWRLQFARAAHGIKAVRGALEHWLEAERDQLVLWLPVMLGAGITAWFLLDDPLQWVAALLVLAAVALAALAIGRGGRAGRSVAVGAATMAAGVALIWLRAESVAAPVLAGPTVVTFEARVERVEPLPPRQLVRLRLVPLRIVAQPSACAGTSRADVRDVDDQHDDDSGRIAGNDRHDALRGRFAGEERRSAISRGGEDRAADTALQRISGPMPCSRDALRSGRRDTAPIRLPDHLRVNIAQADMPAGVTPGAVLRLGARLMPPPGAAVPGAYDYGVVAWFDRIGGTGRAFAPVTVITPGALRGTGLRASLSHHIQISAPGGAGAIAAALATGDQGAIPLDDADAMRRSGLAHLLSVSGLHITAVVAATMFLVLRVLALFPWLALRFRLPLVAGAAGALAAIGYTLLTGAEVPTIRSCVAALLVLTALAMGREAMTLRLVAAGAFVVLLLYPESLAGPSFQLSFAAVASIVALHEHPRIRGWFLKRDERWWRKVGRELGSLLLTGFVVELALLPISVFHFHRAGVYGAVANIVAIPLTTFVTMPFEALALLFDLIGAGAPFWWLTAKSLDLLLWIAHTTASLPGAVAAIPSTPRPAFALMMVGGIWIGLWRTRWRRLGVLPLAIGAAWALATPAPDILVTGDGRHVGIRTADGGLALLRDRTGDYTADMMAENGGIGDLPVLLSDRPDARCSRDLCLADRIAGGRHWRILATRSSYQVPADQLITACQAADIVISDRRLPRRCVPHWLKLDPAALAKTGGIAISLASGTVKTVRDSGDHHPWATALNRNGAAVRRAYPARGPARGRNAVGHRPGWPDRDGSSRPRDENI